MFCFKIQLWSLECLVSLRIENTRKTQTAELTRVLMKFSMCFCHNDLGESLWMTLNLLRCSCSDFPVLTFSSTLEQRKYGKSRICLKAIHMSKSSHPGLFNSALVLFSPLSQPDSVIYATE